MATRMEEARFILYRLLYVRLVCCIRSRRADILNEAGMTRRQLLSIPTLGLPLSRAARAQSFGGMAARNVRPAPRGKPSGLPFDAKFVNVAAQAGCGSR